MGADYGLSLLSDCILELSTVITSIVSPLPTTTLTPNNEPGYYPPSPKRK